MVGVQADRVTLTVGDQGVVAPVRPQGGLRAGKAGAAHDQPVLAEGGLGDLGLAAVGVVDVGPDVLSDGGDGLADGAGLAHRDGEPDAVAAAGSQDLGCPEPRVGPKGELPGRAGPPHAAGELVDEPLSATTRRSSAGALAGVQHLAGVGPGGQQRVVAEQAGVAVGGTALVRAVDLAHGGVHVHRHGLAPGPGASRPCPGKDLFSARSSWRMWPKVNERRNVPSVLGAITRWPSTLAVAPVRSTSALSLQSPPATSACTRVRTLRPGRYAPGRPPRSTSWSTTASISSRSANVAVSSRPALATACRHRTTRRARLGYGTMTSRKCPPSSGSWPASQPPF